MKLLYTSLLAAMLLTLNACSESKKESAPAGKTEEAGKMYVCPMKCTEPVENPGKCVKCGMQLEEMSAS